jgi:2-polyprenyl-3-methyl-5-hydroxy-6-metoxy-1,4-benzoquinol methylase
MPEGAPVRGGAAADNMRVLANDNRACGICGQRCQLRLDGLFDDRFGAPGTFAIVECAGCGLEQTWPRPSEDELKELYERFYNAGIRPGSAYRGLRERFFTSGLYRLWLKWDGDMGFHGRRGAGRLLDVGCNEGRGLPLYADNGFQVEGLELNEQAAAVARRRGFPVHTAALAQFRPAAPYDVVVLANVLEHAWDPVTMLAEVRRLVRPGGEVWISCPNAASRWRRVFGRAWVNWHVPYHLWHFSPATLQVVLKRAGYEVASLKTYTPALWVAQSLCVSLGARQGRSNRVMRSAPVAAGLTLMARAMVLPWFRHLNRELRGDCLIVTARPREG